MGIAGRTCDCHRFSMVDFQSWFAFRKLRIPSNMGREIPNWRNLRPKPACFEENPGRVSWHRRVSLWISNFSIDKEVKFLWITRKCRSNISNHSAVSIQNHHFNHTKSPWTHYESPKKSTKNHHCHGKIHHEIPMAPWPWPGGPHGASRPLRRCTAPRDCGGVTMVANSSWGFDQSHGFFHRKKQLPSAICSM